MGSRLVRKWLKQPLLSRFELEERLDLVEAFATTIELRDMLRSEVRTAPAFQIPSRTHQPILTLPPLTHLLPIASLPPLLPPLSPYLPFLPSLDPSHSSDPSPNLHTPS